MERKETYYVIKDGHIISDYDNYEDARAHARCVDGDVASEDECFPERVKESIESLIEDCQSLTDDIEESQKDIEFLIDQYKINKRWFKPERGRVTVEDIIKTTYEFGRARGKLSIEKDNDGNDESNEI